MAGKKSDLELLVVTSGEQETESVTATGEKSIAQPNVEEPLPYYLILAGDDLQVTFDNNGDNNYWSYHTSSSHPNVSELFHMELVGDDKVKIFGYLPPPTSRSQVKWYLTISENQHGIPDTYPKFMAEDGPLDGSEDFILHTEFTRHDSQADINSFGLSFTTKSGETHYLLPVNRKRRIGWSTNMQYPFLMVSPPEDMKLVDLQKAKKKCCKCC